MNFRAESAAKAVQLSIAAVERDTGIGKDTLRIWERRYGFPNPGRDAFGERTYPTAQVEKLRLIKRLMDQGQRPGRVVPLASEDLLRLSQNLPTTQAQLTPTESHSPHAHVARYLQLIRDHDTEGLRAQLHLAWSDLGLEAFVMQVVAPVTAAVGDAWVRGEMEVYEEHFYTECVSALLRHAKDSLPQAQATNTPRVMLTTFAQEPHGLGLLMAQSLLALQGAHCLWLGTQMPIQDIAKAAIAHSAQVVALSFSAIMNPKQVVEGLNELCALLPLTTEVWAGGQNSALKRRKLSRVVCVQGLGDVAPQVQRWRAEHAT